MGSVQRQLASMNVRTLSCPSPKSKWKLFQVSSTGSEQTTIQQSFNVYIQWLRPDCWSSMELIAQDFCCLVSFPRALLRHAQNIWMQRSKQLQWRNQEFFSGGSHRRCQSWMLNYFAQRSFRCHSSISDLLQQDMTLNVFYQSASINFDKQMFALTVINNHYQAVVN